MTGAAGRPQYRDDIDALRLVAVLAVIGFHFEIDGFSGGFVGVDIFFAISGYLITGIILRELLEGEFSFATFYGRRLRRLMPALLLTCIAVLLMSWWKDFPPAFSRQAVATATAVTGTSNLFFWSESGYFDIDALAKPLLHTWSLAVEAQFYLIWPLLLVLLFRRGGVRAVEIGIVAIALLSLLLAEYLLRAAPMAAFFLTPPRGWEFCVGGIVALIERGAAPRQSVRDAVSLAAVLAIAGSVFFLDRHSLFPGIAAAPAVFGTAALIWAGRDSLVARLITTAPTVWLGKASYSIYLVHWPLYLFAREALDRPLMWWETAALIMATLALAALSYRFVERQFRNGFRGQVSFGAVNRIIGGVTAAACVLSLFVWSGSGLSARLAASSEIIAAANRYDIEAAKRHVWHRVAGYEQADAFQAVDRPRVLLVGDSQAADLLNMLHDARVTETVEIIMRTVFYECGVPWLAPEERDAYWRAHHPELLGKPDLVRKCHEQMDRLAGAPALQQADRVIAAFLWQDADVGRVLAALDRLDALGPAPLYVAGSKLMAKGSIDILNAAQRIEGIERFAAGYRHPDSMRINTALRDRYGARFIDLARLICPDAESCRVLTPDKQPLFWDPSHITREGAAHVWNEGGREMFGFLREGG